MLKTFTLPLTGIRKYVCSSTTRRTSQRNMSLTPISSKERKVVNGNSFLVKYSSFVTIKAALHGNGTR